MMTNSKVYVSETSSDSLSETREQRNTTTNYHQPDEENDFGQNAELPFTIEVVGESGIYYVAAKDVFNAHIKTGNLRQFTFDGTSFVFTQACWRFCFTRKFFHFIKRNNDKIVDSDDLRQWLGKIPDNLTSLVGHSSFYLCDKYAKGIIFWNIGGTYHAMLASQLLGAYSALLERQTPVIMDLDAELEDEYGEDYSDEGLEEES